MAFCDPDEQVLFEEIRKNQEEAVKNVMDQSKLLTILVAGASNNGKSSVVSHVFGRNVGIGLDGDPTTKYIRTWESKTKRLLLIDTPGLEKKDNKGVLAQLSTCKPDIIWLVLNFNSSIEQEELDIANVFPRVPTIVILNKVDTLVINTIKDEDMKDFDSIDGVLPDKLKANKKLMAVRQRLLNWKSSTSPNIKRILLMSLRNDRPTDIPVGVLNLCEATWMNCDQVACMNFMQAQEAWKNDKIAYSIAAIVLATSLAIGAGVMPVPGADLVGVGMVQWTMLGSLCKIWNMTGDNMKIFMDVMTRNLSGTVFTSGIGFVFASLLKIIPGAGTVLGGSTNGCIAGTLTIILGATATACLMNIHDGHMIKNGAELENKMNDYLKSDRFKNFLNHVKELAKTPVDINRTKLTNLIKTA